MYSGETFYLFYRPRYVSWGSSPVGEKKAPPLLSQRGRNSWAWRCQGGSCDTGPAVPRTMLGTCQSINEQPCHGIKRIFDNCLDHGLTWLCLRDRLETFPIPLTCRSLPRTMRGEGTTPLTLVVTSKWSHYLSYFLLWNLSYETKLPVRDSTVEVWICGHYRSHAP